VALTVAGVESPWVPKLDGGTLPASVTQGLGDAEHRGADLFVAKACFACHAIDGAGGRRGPDLSHVASHMSRDQITARIATGGGGMPAFAGSLTPAELDDLTALLQSRH
jgi:ubiquinol-cytochrome c reductase cytochrome b subunit